MLRLLRNLLLAAAGGLLLASLFELLAEHSWFVNALGLLSSPMFDLLPAKGIPRLCYLLTGLLIGRKVHKRMLEVALAFCAGASLVHIKVYTADPAYAGSNLAPLGVVVILGLVLSATLLGAFIAWTINHMKYPAVSDKPED